MKKAGCLVVLVGLVLGVVSLALFGASIFKAQEAREVAALPLSVGAEAATEALDVDTERFCQVAVQATVSGRNTERETGGDGYRLRYAFPFHYVVRDESGAVVFEQTIDFGSSGTKTWTSQEVGRDGGRETITNGFAKFPVPAPGRVTVTATLSADTVGGAALENPRLLVHDRVSKHAGRVVAGIGLLFVAGFTVLIGGVLGLIGLVRGG